MSSHANDVVPEGVTLETLRKRERQSSTTPRSERKRCPSCHSADVVRVHGSQMSPTDGDHDYRCGQCCERFDDPVRGER